MSEVDVEFHDSFKPRWVNFDTLMLPELESFEPDVDYSEHGIAFHKLEGLKQVCYAQHPIFQSFANKYIQRTRMP